MTFFVSRGWIENYNSLERESRKSSGEKQQSPQVDIYTLKFQK